MIAKFTANNQGYVTDSKITEFQIGRFEAHLQFGEEFLEEIILETVLSDHEVDELIAEIEPNRTDDKADHNLTLALPGDLHDIVMDTFQIIESFGGLHDLRGINWDQVGVRLVPQTPEERDRIDVSRWKVRSDTPIQASSWEFDLDSFDWEHIKALRSPLSFYRRGIQLVDEQDYVNAYTQFYMVLEGFYTDSSRNEEEQMAESDEMLAAAEYGYQSVMDNEDLAKEITPFIDRYGDRSPEGYIETLVVVRHKLSHFFYQEKEIHSPDPLKVDEFEPLCRCVRQLAWYILQVKINKLELES